MERCKLLKRQMMRMEIKLILEFSSLSPKDLGIFCITNHEYDAAQKIINNLDLEAEDLYQFISYAYHSLDQNNLDLSMLNFLLDKCAIQIQSQEPQEEQNNHFSCLNLTDYGCKATAALLTIAVAGATAFGFII